MCIAPGLVEREICRRLCELVQCLSKPWSLSFCYTLLYTKPGWTCGGSSFDYQVRLLTLLWPCVLAADTAVPSDTAPVLEVS